MHCTHERTHATLAPTYTLRCKHEHKNQDQRTWHGHYCHLACQVLLKFHNDFVQSVWIKGRSFKVRFSVNRSQFNLVQVSSCGRQLAAGSWGLHAGNSVACQAPATTSQHHPPVPVLRTP